MTEKAGHDGGIGQGSDDHDVETDARSGRARRKRPGMTEGSGRDLTTTTLKQMPGQAGHDGKGRA